MRNFHQPSIFASNGLRRTIVQNDRMHTFVPSHDVLTPNSLRSCAPAANMSPYSLWPEHTNISHRRTPMDQNYPGASKSQHGFLASNRASSLYDLRPTYEMYEPSRVYAGSMVPNHVHEASIYHPRQLTDSHFTRSWISTHDIPQTTSQFPPNSREIHGARSARRHFYRLGMDEDDIQATFF
jgi:hypothetical protein